MKSRWLIALIVGCASMSGAWWLCRSIPNSQTTPGSNANSAVDDHSSEDTVELSLDKRSAFALQTVTVESRYLKETRFVPGRVHYDDSRHAEIKASASGVLTKSLVKPGDNVKAGQVLAHLSSPEIGGARADVSKRQAELALAKRSFDWMTQTSQNVDELILRIRRGSSMKEIEAEFQKRPLGEYRTTLIAAYSRLQLAEWFVSNIKAAAESGALPARSVLERSNERETADAALKAGCEQSAFDVRQKWEEAKVRVEDAQRRFDISRQHLTTLLGYDESLLAKATSPPDDLSLVESRAPFDGTIERKSFSVSEHVKSGDTLFVLANTNRLWIAADLREREWQALRLTAGQELSVEAPALGERKLTARVHYIGREVSPDSNAVPLIAQIDNSEELLRPGLFVRVAIPLEPTAPVLAVPVSAVVKHEREQFVFVTGSADGQFQKRPIRTGRDDGEWVEVVSGLQAGTSVVSQGAFVLKSELLLERN